MAQFNVDSEVIAAKSAQARSYVASITADVNGMTASCTICRAPGPAPHPLTSRAYWTSGMQPSARSKHPSPRSTRHSPAQA